MGRRSIKTNSPFCRGSVLAYGLVIMTVTMIILTSMISYIVSQLNFSNNRVEKQKALEMAEAGIYWYRWYLAHETAGKTAQEIGEFWQSGSAYGVGSPYQADFVNPANGEKGTYSLTVEAPDPGSTIIVVTSAGWTQKMPELKRTIQVRFRRPSWSEFAVLANDFMRFGENTEVFGKIHSNFGIRFDGLAHNVISSSVATYDDPDHSGGNEFGVHTHVTPYGGSVNNSFQRNEAPPSDVQDRPDVFEAGREFPVANINFNGLVSDFSFMRSEARSGNGIYYDNTSCVAGGSWGNYGRHIVLNGTTMTVTVVTKYNTTNNSITKEGCVLNNVPIPQEGIVFVENNIWIEGTVNGRRVTFVAANNTSSPSIYIGMNNILYTHLDGTDVIGLIAKKDIEVVKNSLDDLTVDAALISASGRIGRDDYTPFGCGSQSCQDHKGTITINGALATDMRYGFAYTNGTGYSQRILNFDNNLLYGPPPYFPTGTQYSIDLWEEL